MIIKNATIETAERAGAIQNGYIEIKNGKILRVGDMSEWRGSEADRQVIDAAGGFILPGFVDAHTHVGIIGDSLGFEGDDLNEMTDPATPQLRAVDAVNPMDICFQDAYRAGVTTVVTGPGSANAISGQMIAMKTFGTCIDDMIMKSPAAIKFALGENPKGVYHGKNQAPETRMATASIIREALKKAVKYKEDLESARRDKDSEPPDFDFKCEALLPLLRREIPAHFHAHRADDIFTAVRISREFSVDFAIVHCTEGHLVAKELYGKREKNKKIRAFVGPLLCDRSKPELKNLNVGAAKILSEHGIELSIVSDHSAVPIQYLLLCAMLAVKAGLNRETALRAVTINPARAVGLDHRIGSIKEGKDADLILFDGDPFEFYTTIKQVLIDGQTVYRA